MFKNIKIDRYNLLESVGIDPNEDFDIVDNFERKLRPFIFDRVEITNDEKGLETAFQSRLQQLVSETLLRSLMLKEGMVIALNNNNFPSYYAILKAFLEIPAVLGYIVHNIYNLDDYEKIIPNLNQLHLGTRDVGNFSIGDMKAINVLTMFEKLDSVLLGIACSDKSPEEVEKITNGEKVLSTLYSDTCNYGHPNFNAHMSVGILHGDGIWVAKHDVEGYKCELWAFYMPSFIICIEIISLLCGLVVKNEKVLNYSRLDNPLYFQE